jgi:hypothetical protein
MHSRSIEESVFDIIRPSARRGQAPHGPSHGNAPPPPPPRLLVNLVKLLATQNELMRMLMENDACRGAGHLQHPHQQDMDSSYSEFLVTHLPLFYEPMEPLKENN